MVSIAGNRNGGSEQQEVPLDQREKGGKHSISRGKGSRVAGFGAGYSPQGSR